jgi:PTS system ascorbate-specific IIC component
MDIFLNFVTSFFASAGLVVALFALVGSLILKRGVTKTIISTFMSALGFFILSIGAGAMGSALTHFQKEFSVILGYGNDTGNQGNAIVADSNTFAVGIMFFSSRISAVASIMLLLAIVFNLLLAKFSNFKNIYLSTHILMYFSIGFTSVFQLCGCDLGLDKMGLVVALLGAMLLATYSTMAPSISTKISFEVMGEKNINLCHHDLFSFQIAS